MHNIIIRMETQAAILSKTQCVRETHRIRQHLGREWPRDVSGRHPSLDKQVLEYLIISQLNAVKYFHNMLMPIYTQNELVLQFCNNRGSL